MPTMSEAPNTKQNQPKIENAYKMTDNGAQRLKPSKATRPASTKGAYRDMLEW